MGSSQVGMSERNPLAKNKAILALGYRNVKK